MEDGSLKPALQDSPFGRVATGRILEACPVEGVLLELLGDAPARQAAVLGAAGDVPLVVGQQAGEVVALDAADQVVGQVGERALDVDQRAGVGGPGGRAGRPVAGRASRWIIEPSAIATAALIAFSSSRTCPGQGWSRSACIASESISVTGGVLIGVSFSRKCIASSGMSSGRSRSGGRSIRITFRR